MNKLDLASLILGVVCGFICIGFGIYYCFSGDSIKIAVFMVVGAVCLINAVRAVIKFVKSKKGGDKKDKTDLK